MKQATERRGRAQVLLVDDHPIVRERLAQLINQQSGLAVCGECEDAPTCLSLIEKHKPHLVIVDLSLRGTHGIELIKDIIARQPEQPILVLSMHDESVFAERALRAGARGYITKHEATDQVMLAIRRVLDGQIYLSDKMAAQLVSVFIHGRKKDATSPIERLTDRELEVFQMIGQGRTTRQIAEALKLDVKTVETYRYRMKEKLNVESASELLQHAIQWAQSDSTGGSTPP